MVVALSLTPVGREDVRDSAHRFVLYSTSQRDCFTKKNRLKDTAAFKRVFTSGHEGHVGVLKWFAHNNGGTTARLGIAIPKRLVKTAVQRNRIKRLIRESFRLNQEKLTGIDVIVVLRKSTDEQQIRVDLSETWMQVVKYSEKQGFNKKAD